jgi:hypothetical protein
MLMSFFALRTTIPAGQALSGPIAPANYGVCWVLMPDFWTEAPLTVQGSVAEGLPTVWADLYDHLGNEVVLTVGAGRALTLPPTLLLGWRWLRLRSGLANAPVNQAAARLLTLGVRPFA